MRQRRIAIVGATGLVGQEVLRVLEQRNFPVGELRLLASDRSVGKKIVFRNQELSVEATTAKAFDGMDFAFFAAGGDVSKEYAPIAAEAGALVIDKSGTFRMEPDVPLVVPEVNLDDAKAHKGIIASPNCSTIQLVVAMNPLHQRNRIKHMTVATYQSVSGSGREAVEELNDQAERVLHGKPVAPHFYPHQIAFNVLPQCDNFLDDGDTQEEWKLIHETRKIMHEPALRIGATCVRVPVVVGHSEAVHVEFTRYLSPEDARHILVESPGVKVLDDPVVALYPYPWMASGQDEVFVGRIRPDDSLTNGLALWVVSDNLRKGAALNAVQIAEEVLRRGWL